jgi:hypothetical protein
VNWLTQSAHQWKCREIASKIAGDTFSEYYKSIVSACMSAAEEGQTVEQVELAMQRLSSH